MPSARWIVILGIAAFLVLLPAGSLRCQEPQSPAPPTPPAPPTAPATSQKSGKQKYSHANDFLIEGTVFNEKGLSFAGVQLRVRRKSEKKFRWESATGSRGDFAVRVPQGSEYEMVVHARGFADQTRTVDAKAGENEERMVFRMEPVAGGKK
jgi:Carboxypeptidase regulatory-like domain